MRKHYLSFLSLAALVFTMLLGMVSCKKDVDSDTPNPTGSDFFIEVDFLPKNETNGATAPRLIANFNDEAVMVEFRPNANTNAETVLFLCPDNEAIMMCGNDSLLILASYDLATYTPSDDVLVVTRTDDLMLLTKCVMDWNLNTMTKGDMMVLPIDDNSKGSGKKGDFENDMRLFFYNHLVKPLINRLEQAENLIGFLGIHTGIVLTYVKTIVATTFPVILFSDDSELLYEAMEQPVAMGTAQAAQFGVLYNFKRDLREMGYRLYSGLAWALHGGRGKVNDFNGYGGEVSDSFPYTTLKSQSNNVIESAGRLGIQLPAYKVNLNVSNVTENSAYLKGNFQFTSSITPIAMGYVFKVSGGPEQIVEDFNFNGKTITGLQKATKYQAYAYVENMEGKVISPEVSFWTLGFEAFPSSLTFPAEGDTKYVALSYSHEDITSWNITSKPSWCTTAIDDLGLLTVTVDASTETRSGTITITAHSTALGSITQNVTVTQNGPTPPGYFSGTSFDNVLFTLGMGNEMVSTTWTDRLGDGWNNYTHTYSSFHNETHTDNINETIDQFLSWPVSFNHNALTDGWPVENLYWNWHFVNDSIIISGDVQNYAFISKFKNGNTYDSDCYNTALEIEPLLGSTSIHNYGIGTFIITRYFEQDNVFCIKVQYTGNSNWEGSENHNWLDWMNQHGEVERLNKFIIDENSNNCTFEMIETINSNTISHGSQYTGILSLTSTRHWIVNGTWDRLE